MNTPSVNNRTRNFLLLITLPFLLLTILLVFVLRNTGLDEAVFEAITPYRTAGCTRIMKAISFVGNHSFLVPANILFIVFLLLSKNKMAALSAGVTALSSLGLMSLLKNLISRNRPSDPLVQGITNFAYPSGHAFMSVAFYGLIIWWAALHINNKIWRRGIISFLLLLILLIGFSRIYLRVHYTTDVIAGFSLGTLWLIACWSLMKKFITRPL